MIHAQWLDTADLTVEQSANNKSSKIQLLPLILIDGARWLATANGGICTSSAWLVAQGGQPSEFGDDIVYHSSPSISVVTSLVVSTGGNPFQCANASPFKCPAFAYPIVWRARFCNFRTNKNYSH